MTHVCKYRKTYHFKVYVHNIVTITIMLEVVLVVVGRSYENIVYAV